jgi:DNA-directed RNA polymerase subunit RPC12/RpoP
MKVKYTNKSGSLCVDFDASSQKELFSQLAMFQEVFDETTCGKCGSDNLKFVVRNVDDNEYYELRCMDCGAKLLFGVNKNGRNLFPKKKDDKGNWLPDRGWIKWDKNLQKNV